MLRLTLVSGSWDILGFWDMFLKKSWFFIGGKEWQQTSSRFFSYPLLRGDNLASKFSSDSTQCLWITPGSRESPGDRAPGRAVRAVLWKTLYGAESFPRGRTWPQRAKDQRQTQIRSDTNATPGSNLGEMERGLRAWMTGPVDTRGKRSALEKTWEE